MFNYFFIEYEKINKIKISKLELYLFIKRHKIKSAFILISILIFVGGLFISLVINNTIYKIIATVIIGIELFVFFVYAYRVSKKGNLEWMKSYKNNSIINLILLLKHEDFNFYSIKKIDWLIKCCDVELSCEKWWKGGLSAIKVGLLTVLYPIITLILGAIINNFSVDILLRIAFIILYVFILLCILFFPFYIIYKTRNSRDRKIRILKQELEYIKLDFVNS